MRVEGLTKNSYNNGEDVCVYVCHYFVKLSPIFSLAVNFFRAPTLPSQIPLTLWGCTLMTTYLRGGRGDMSNDDSSMTDDGGGSPNMDP